MRLSYWDRESIQGDWDVVIVGAGIVGLSAAIRLRELQPSLAVLVLEDQPVGALASSRNAGFACFGSVSEIYGDIERYGEEATLDILHRRVKGLASLLEALGPHNLGYKNYGGYEVFMNAEDFERQAERVKQMNALIGRSVFSVVDTPTGVTMHNQAICNHEEGQLRTDRLYGLLTSRVASLGIRILRGAKARLVDKPGVLSCKIGPYEDELQISANRVLITTNALTTDIVPTLDVTPVRNQVLISEPIKGLQLKGTFHQDEGFIYFRNVGDRILIGGARHRFPQEEIGILGQNEDNLAFLHDYVLTYLNPDNSDVAISHSWSGILSGSHDRLPIVKKLDDKTTVAVRLGGMGVAIGWDIGMEAATLVLT